jgi:glucokinase
MIKIGVDIGGTSIKIGIINGIKVLDSINVPSLDNMIVKSIEDGIKQLLTNNKLVIKDVTTIGVTLPGPVVNHLVDETVNLALENRDLRSALFKTFKYAKIVVLNDANAAAIGESSLTNKKHRISCFVTLGTGVGGGVIYDGKLLDGFSGVGFEIGHIPIGSNFNLSCGCGNKDCLETVCSAKGLSNLFKKLKSDQKSTLTSHSNAKDIFDAAKAGDKFALRITDVWAQYLAKGLYVVALTANPSVIIIGGGISKAGEFLLNKVKDKFNEQAAFKSLKKTEIVLAKLGNDAGMIGAVKFAEMI